MAIVENNTSISMIRIRRFLICTYIYFFFSPSEEKIVRMLESICCMKFQKFCFEDVIEIDLYHSLFAKLSETVQTVRPT